MKRFLKENWFKMFCFITSFTISFFIFVDKTNAQSGCSEYGIMAYQTGGYCKCMSGYVMGTFLGKPYCVSGNSACMDDYGYGAQYDSLSGKCECSYGYIFGKDILGNTSCISTRQYCRDKLGINSTYNSVSDACECSSGNVLRQKILGSGYECVSCMTKYGLYSSYNYLSKQCECNSGYTLNESNQCVKKQNNVYFMLKELDTDAKKAIIRSDYDYRYYLISYNSGCYSSSFRRYLNHQIVVNLGTDFDLDTWDKIVLQDDDEVCDITRVEKAYSSTTLKPKEEIAVHKNFIQPAPPIKTEDQNNPAATPTPQIKQQTLTPSKPITPKVVTNKDNESIVAASSVAKLVEASSSPDINLDKTDNANEQKSDKPTIEKQKSSLLVSISNFFTKISEWIKDIFKKLK